MKGRVFPRPYQLVDGERRPIKGKSTWTYEFMVTRNGKRRSISKGGFRTKKDADAALAAALVEHGRDPGREPVKPSTLSLEDFIHREWLPALVGLKPSTVRGYQDLAAAYVIPHIGGDRLCDLTPGRIAQLYATLRTSGRRRRTGGLSESTVHAVHVLIGKVLTYAVETGALASSPVTRLPRDSRPKAQAPDPAKLKVWTREQTARFLAATATDDLAPLWRLAIDSGMRRGELAALRWDDVDLDAGAVTVRRNRVTIGYEVSEGTPKTRQGQRSIHLAPETVTALRAHRKAQAERQLAWGPAWADRDGLVFTREDGSPMHPQTIGWHLRQASRAAGLPPIGVHGLRHTSATLGLAAGVPLKVMSERLGHSSTTVTADLYQHVVPGMQAEAAARIMEGLG